MSIFSQSAERAARATPNGVKKGATFLLVFRCLNHTASSRKAFNGVQKGQGHSKKHKLSKKYFCGRSISGSPPAGLKVHSFQIRSLRTKLGWIPCFSERVGTRAQANFSAPTFEPEQEGRAGQRAALSVQSAAAAMQHLDQRSASELSAKRAAKNVNDFCPADRNLSCKILAATFRARNAKLFDDRWKEKKKRQLEKKRKKTAWSTYGECLRPPLSLDRQSPQPRSLQVSFQICRFWFLNL